jgi:D-sedoheptulose 7-phosphate isomerase
VPSSRSSWGEEIASQLQASGELLRRTAASADLLARMATVVADALTAGSKVLLCGNGGSAADAQHMATELLARYKLDRQPLAAIALGTDVTYLTAMSNDTSFEHVFSRQVEGLGRRGDVLWVFSTSGNSPNVLAAVKAARDQGLATIGFTGASGGKLKSAVDYCLCVPSLETPRIQEVHTAAAHAICDLVERELAGSG